MFDFIFINNKESLAFSSEKDTIQWIIENT